MKSTPVKKLLFTLLAVFMLGWCPSTAGAAPFPLPPLPPPPHHHGPHLPPPPKLPPAPPTLPPAPPFP